MRSRLCVFMSGLFPMYGPPNVSHRLRLVRSVRIGNILFNSSIFILPISLSIQSRVHEKVELDPISWYHS